MNFGKTDDNVINSTIFLRKYFYFDNASVMEKVKLTKIIENCGGVVEEHLTENVTHIIAQDERLDYFRRILNKSIIIVSCRWVYVCANFKKIVPSNQYSPDKRSRMLNYNLKQNPISLSELDNYNYTNDQNNFQLPDLKEQIPLSSEEDSISITDFNSSMFDSFVSEFELSSDSEKEPKNIQNCYDYEIKKSWNIEDNLCISVPIRILIKLISAFGDTTNVHIKNIIEELKMNLNLSVIGYGAVLDILHAINKNKHNSSNNRSQSSANKLQIPKTNIQKNTSTSNNLNIKNELKNDVNIKNDRIQNHIQSTALNVNKKLTASNDVNNKNIKMQDMKLVKNVSKSTNNRLDQNGKDNQPNGNRKNVVYDIVRKTDDIRGSSSLFESPNIKSESFKPGIVCTYFNQKDLKMLYSMIKQLGVFEIENNVTPRTTHVICKGYKKTLNLHKALTRGCWILDKQWVISSARENRWLFEEKFERSDLNPAFKECRIRKQEFGITYSSDIFVDCGSIYVSENCDFNKADVSELISVCSGKLASNTRLAEVVVGKFPAHKCNVKVDWVFNSVWHNRLSNVEHYRIT